MKRKRVFKFIIVVIVFFIISLLLFVKNIQKISFVKNIEHAVLEDIATSSGNDEEKEASNFVLTTKVNLEAANGHGGVDLDWSTYDPNRKSI